jgi:hypothetical protein
MVHAVTEAGDPARPSRHERPVVIQPGRPIPNAKETELLAGLTRGDVEEFGDLVLTVAIGDPENR